MSEARKFHTRDLGKLGGFYLEKTAKICAENEKDTRLANKQLTEILDEFFGIMTALETAAQERSYDQADASLRQQMFLVAQFSMVSVTAYQAILSAQYPVGANTLKQLLEHVAAFDEIDRGQRRDGKTPKISGRLEKYGRTYGKLNEIAHPAKADAVEAFSSYSSENKYGPTSYPIFLDQTSKALLGRFADIFLQMLTRVNELFQRAFRIGLNEIEKKKIFFAISTLSAYGHVSIDKH